MFSKQPFFRHLIGSATLLLSLAACDAKQPPIDIAAISSVQGEIKRQLLVYMLAAEKSPIDVKLNGPNGPKTNLRLLTPDERRQYFWCGDGSIDYDITSIKAELQTSLVNSAGGSIGFTVPVPIAPSGAFSFSRQSSTSQTLDYTQWPIPYAMQSDELKAQAAPTDVDLKAAPIAQVLLNLRYAQIAAALKVRPLTGADKIYPEACLTNFSLAKPSDDPKNSYTMALTINVTVDGSVSVGVAAAKIGLSVGSNSTTGHSLTVSFAQRDLETMQAFRDVVDKKCAAPNAFSDDCRKAQKAYTEVIYHAMTGAEVSAESLRILGVGAAVSAPGTGRSPGTGGTLVSGGGGSIGVGPGFPGVGSGVGVLSKRGFGALKQFDAPLQRQ